MTIVEALMDNKYCVRVHYGTRWLIFDTTKKVWTVYEHKPRARATKTLVETELQDEAVAKLVKY